MLVSFNFFRFNNKKTILNNKGVALFEILPLLVVFIALVGMTVGLWGAVHSGVLQSIAARHYAFEVINNRTHFEYHRDVSSNPDGDGSMAKSSPAIEGDFHGRNGMRLFVVTGDRAPQTSSPQSFVSTRGINFFEELERGYGELPKGSIEGQSDTSSADFHRSYREGEIQAINPIWLMTGYGICLDHSCGD